MLQFIAPRSTTKKRWRVLGSLSIAAIWLLFHESMNLPGHYGRQLLLGSRAVDYPIPFDQKVKPYDNGSVLLAQKHMLYLQALLVFDGSDNTFKTFVGNTNLDHNRRLSVPLLITYALRKFFPERFQKGQPSFQLIFDTTDKVPSNCHREEDGIERCRTDEWAPHLFFGTVPKDTTLYPTVKALPNASYLGCFLDINCGIFKIPENPPVWDDLIPTIIWRGSDHGYLYDDWVRGFRFGVNVQHLDKERSTKELVKRIDGMTPRWRAVLFSLLASQEEVPWIDVKFTVSEQELKHFSWASFGTYNQKLEFELATSKYVGEDEQIKYKYHIDFGGGGGTTWTGTFRKLGMPGVLFHHETPVKDWYFDEIQPWVHYIPVKEDLSDLKQMYEWAEANPQECQEISKRATDFFLDFRTRENLQDMYQRFFHTYLGKVVQAYAPQENESVQDILDSYKEGFGEQEYSPYSTCDEVECINHKGYHTLTYEMLDQNLLAEGVQPQEQVPLFTSFKESEETPPLPKIDLEDAMKSVETDTIDELLTHSEENRE